jgi:holo-[acyl-carrier protein] synthase
MIYGIGTDIVQISRMDAALARHGERWAEKILGADEFQIYRERKEKVAARAIRYLATRFAAKEAFSKAIKLAVPMSWHAMQMLNAANGQPNLVTSGALTEFMAHHDLTAQVSISDEAEYALAFVIIEKT